MSVHVEEVNEGKQYLSFTLADELYAVDITKVREVLDYVPITKIPKSPEFMRGVINLRGNIVPVVDLRMKFRMSKTERQVNTCIIILEVFLDGEPLIIGALADAVQEVFEFNYDQIGAPPKIGTRLNVEFIRGMGNRNEQLVIILDIDIVFSAKELELVQHADLQAERLPAGANQPRKEEAAEQYAAVASAT